MNQPQNIIIDGETYSFDDLVKDAEKDNPALMALLADILVLGKYGVQKDETRGWQYYQRAANANNPDALFQMGLAYFDGGHFQTNEKAGIKYLQAAADAGHIDAQYIYGCMLKDRNKTGKSAHYFELSARQGQAKSQYQLGLYYFFDVKNIDNAIFWLCHSSLRGDADANNMLNEMIQRGVPRAYDRIQNTFTQIKTDGNK